MARHECKHTCVVVDLCALHDLYVVQLRSGLKIKDVNEGSGGLEGRSLKNTHVLTGTQCYVFLQQQQNANPDFKPDVIKEGELF